MTTQEREPLAPTEDEAERTGDWSDWIAAPEPVAAQYDEPEYDDYEYEDDDEYYEPELRPHLGARHRRSAPTPLRSKPRKGPYPAWAAPLLGVLAILAVAAAIAVQVAKVSPSESRGPMPTVAPPAAVSTTSAQPAAATNPALCPNETSGTTVRGNGPGSTRSGTDAILALQSRYYVERNGQRVREMFAPDATPPSVADIQAGIDSIPVGSTYCVQIMPGPFAGQHIMVVTETHPDASRRVWPPQLVLTSTTGDITLVSSIVPLADGVTPR